MSVSPVLSVVVAGVNISATLNPWISALEPQLKGHDIEVLLVCTETDAAPRKTVAGFSETLSVPAGSLVPAMWSAGLQRARGSIIAFTITACIPAADWIASIVTAHLQPYAAIGGVIDHAADAGMIDRALHLVRYTPYLPPQRAGRVLEIAGDNGTYKRAALMGSTAEISRNGFWEAEINRQLRAQGEVLWLDPRICVTHSSSYSAAGFMRQRFIHGRIFGGERRRELSVTQRIARLALASIVPAVMLVRSLRTVSSRGRLDLPTLVATPLALCFFTCWAAGEAVGLLGGG